MARLKFKHLFVGVIWLAFLLAFMIPDGAPRDQESIRMFEELHQQAKRQSQPSVQAAAIMLPPPPVKNTEPINKGETTKVQPLSDRAEKAITKTESETVRPVTEVQPPKRSTNTLPPRLPSAVKKPVERVTPLEKSSFKEKRAEATETKKIKRPVLQSDLADDLVTTSDKQKSSDHLKARSPVIQPRSNQSIAREGRVLLKLLEHGRGPLVEVVWPASSNERKKLYRNLRACHGMTTAIYVPDRGLYLAKSPRSLANQLDTDKFSGFVRQSTGSIVDDEIREELSIRRRHGIGLSGQLVRLFPRSEDAKLLGGLEKLSKNSYRTAKTVVGQYRLKGNRLFVENIIIDENPVGGSIDLSKGACT